ncbi:Zn-ribbon domain-containing OB-fold protein [Frankia sp. Cas3]|uniref:Zn-ribbon domain-containing OB-fold protein n=1 Tax=Frankia sp. Cas3 TaxID=3073926 RepID=UPI002AD42B6A|nr:OB-fold domain-containing protein [Frankia sp. Cas3]
MNGNSRPPHHPGAGARSDLMQLDPGLAAAYFDLPATPPPFPLPARSTDSEFFWASGRDGVLRMMRCADCSYIVHQPSPYCPGCGSAHVAAAALSGRGTVYSFTVAVQTFVPGLAPYCLALVQLEEQADVRLMARLVDVAAADVTIDMPVAVAFIKMSDQVWVPCFTPAPVSPRVTEPANQENL